MRKLIDLAQQLNEGIKDSPQFIENPNSSGQGFHPEHAQHAFHDTLTRNNYRYSHSTPIRSREGGYNVHHTYKDIDNRDNNVGIYRGKWEAGRGGQARKTVGTSPEALDTFLKGRARRDAQKIRKFDMANPIT